MKKAILTILTGAALAVGSAQAEIVFGNLGATGSGGIITGSGGTTLSSTSWRAVGFTANGVNLTLNTATLGLEVNSLGSATIRLDLYTNVSGAPGTSIFDTTQVFSANTSGTFDFNLNQTLTAGSSYWIVASKVAGAGTAFWRGPNPISAPVAYNSSGWARIGGTTSVNGGASWGATGNASGSAISLDASASPIPEPGTWAAMAIFAGGAAYAGWRRRQQQLA